MKTVTKDIQFFFIFVNLIHEISTYIDKVFCD